MEFGDRPEVVVRDLTEADFGAVHALNQANVPAVGDATRQLLSDIVDESLHALVATVPDPSGRAGGEVAGFCLVIAPGADYGSVNFRWFTERYREFVYLDRVAVDARFRGRGIGAALYAEVERRSAGREWFTLEVNLRPRNDGSLAFHERLGFTEVGQQETPGGFLVSLQARPIDGGRART